MQSGWLLPQPRGTPRCPTGQIILVQMPLFSHGEISLISPPCGNWQPLNAHNSGTDPMQSHADRQYRLPRVYSSCALFHTMDLFQLARLMLS